MFKELKNKLLAENRIKSYLIYAFGEIILIVIGILVAMNLDDWNSNQKDIARTKAFLKEIQFDLKRDTTIFGDEIRKIDQVIRYKSMLLQKDSLNMIDSDDIISILTAGYHNIRINEGSYVKMKESGVAEPAQFEKLFKSINNYYVFNKAYLENRNEWEVGLYERDMNQWTFQDKFEIKVERTTKDLQDSIAKRKNLIEMLESPQGRNVLKMSLFREKQMKETYGLVLKAANKLLAKIDSLPNN
ncbi:DUF6090 family protein [Flavobacterium sp.]